MSTPVTFLIMYKGAVGFQVDVSCNDINMRFREKGHTLASSWNTEHGALVFSLMSVHIHTPEFMESDIGRYIINTESAAYTVSVLYLGADKCLWVRNVRDADNAKHVGGDTIDYNDLDRIPNSEECILFCEYRGIAGVDKQMLIGALGAGATREQIDHMVAERHIGNGKPIVWYDLEGLRSVLNVVVRTQGKDNKIKYLVEHGESSRIGPDIKPEEEVKLEVGEISIPDVPSWGKEDMGGFLVREGGTLENSRFTTVSPPSGEKR